MLVDRGKDEHAIGNEVEHVNHVVHRLKEQLRNRSMLVQYLEVCCNKALFWDYFPLGKHSSN